VHHDDARAARILITQLEQPPAELLAAVEAVEAQQHERAARLAELEREASERELDLLLEAKRSFAIAFGALVLAGAVAATILFEKGLLVPTTGLGVIVFSVPLVWSALFSARIRRNREGNEAQRRLASGLRVSAWSTAAIWTAAWVMGVPPATALTFHLVSVAANWLMGAIVFHRRGVIIAAAMAVAVVGTALVPRFAFLVAGVCAFVGFTALGLTQRPRPPSRP
jgi:hypothetical protein